LCIQKQLKTVFFGCTYNIDCLTVEEMLIEKYSSLLFTVL